MAHIHTDPGQHDHTASGFIVRIENGVPKLLLHVHKKLGVLMQFGGHVELHENPWQAVIHEVQEESGYSIDQLTLLQPKDRVKHLTGVVLHPVAATSLTHKFKEGHFHTDTQYVFITDEQPKFDVAEDESADIHALSREELLAQPKDKMPANIREIGLFIFDTCLPKWERVNPDQFSA